MHMRRSIAPSPRNGGVAALLEILGLFPMKHKQNKRLRLWFAAKVLHGERDSNRASGVAQGPPSVFTFLRCAILLQTAVEALWPARRGPLGFAWHRPQLWGRASCIQTFIGVGANNITLSGFQPPGEFPHREEHQADHFLPCCFCWRPRLQDPARSVAPPVCAGLPRSMLPAEHYSEAPRKN